MDTNTLILAGLVGFIASIIKGAPKSIIDLIIYKFGYNISVSSSNSKSYNRVNEYIFNNFKSDVLKRKAKFDTNYVDCKEVQSMSLGLGIVTLLENKSIFIIRHIKEEKKHFEEYQITINIIGLNARKIHNDIINHTLSKTDNNKIGIRYGYVYKNVNGRDIDTIYCSGNKKEIIISSIDRFNDSELIYKNNGIPYRLGILLYGRAGTGKTSMVKAIATYTKRDINVINFKELDNLPSIIEKISDNEILLIEEIDTIVENRDENRKENIKLGNLLNLLDGIGTPENLIVIATTNHIDRLDDALIRNGRFDVKEELEYLTKDECIKILNKKDINCDHLDKFEFPIAPCDLQLKIINK